MGRGLTILLVISLAANVFLGGFLGGRLLGGPPHGPDRDRHPPHGAMMMFSEMDALSPEGRDAFRAVFKAKKPALREDYHEVRRLRDAFGEALAGDPWDRARAEAALGELRVVEESHQSELAALLIDAFAALSPADRKALIAAQEARRDEWRERRKRSRGDEGSRRDGPRGDGPSDDAPPPDGERPPPL